jgi:hypothetical protein
MKSCFSVGLLLPCFAVLGISANAVAALSCNGNTQCYVNEADPSRNIAEGLFKANWSITAGDTLNMTLQAQTTGWVSIGFSTTATMDSTDYVMGGYNAQAANAYGADYFYSLTGPGCPQCAPTLDTLLALGSAPATDSQNNLFGINASETNGITTFSFSRLLTTGDTTGDYDLSQGVYYLEWAFRNTAVNGDDLSKYHSGGRGVLASDITFVPLPSAVWLMGSALLGIAGMRRDFRVGKTG